MFDPITVPFGAKMLFNTVKLKRGVTFVPSNPHRKSPLTFRSHSFIAFLRYPGSNFPATVS